MNGSRGTFLGFAAFFLLGLLAGGFYATTTKPNTCPEDMYCYEPYGAPIAAEYVLDGAIVAIKFVDASEFKNGEEAYAIWEVDYDKNISWCLIKAQFPEQVLGDPRMDALGHELLHCITGNFHP